ncbi:uncharacterized protein BDR25DRAFT_363571 [Lindgomyces ingoldianus]|uniref:Uncharacterized protein n=1 Tax=Lindgomyces ingoldianus TaxID=673940 RepID=A0ACB6Q7D4_9PLEO|nr:uncharacterized protein BDR25DRAFT_363571 [Lindgomyces ingoldianus]KAF2462729.1 hypothetical protein BDR25DRAFT_363571 [Lindgomyces ingoldianus]
MISARNKSHNTASNRSLESVISRDFGFLTSLSMVSRQSAGTGDNNIKIPCLPFFTELPKSKFVGFSRSNLTWLITYMSMALFPVCSLDLFVDKPGFSEIPHIFEKDLYINTEVPEVVRN